VDVHLLGRQAEHGRQALVDGLELLAVPHLEAVGGALDDAVHRLHGGMGQVGKS
jgi:hypothetical protein